MCPLSMQWPGWQMQTLLVRTAVKDVGLKLHITWGYSKWNEDIIDQKTIVSKENLPSVGYSLSTSCPSERSLTNEVQIFCRPSCLKCVLFHSS